MNLPKPQAIAELPNIDWTKYTSPFGTFENVFSREVPRPSKPFTRRKKSVHTAVASTSSQVNIFLWVYFTLLILISLVLCSGVLIHLIMISPTTCLSHKMRNSIWYLSQGPNKRTCTRIFLPTVSAMLSVKQ